MEQLKSITDFQLKNQAQMLVQTVLYMQNSLGSGTWKYHTAARASHLSAVEKIRHA
jgi:hypothetical protein